MIDTLILKFDPSKSDDPMIQQVFADDLARTLWLGIKQGHLASQYFNKECLWAAKQIREAQDNFPLLPLTAEGLFDILSNRATVYPGLIGSGEREKAFAAELLPYVLGESQLTYRIET